MKDEQIRQILLEENPEFRELYREHQALESRLQQLLEKRYLTPDEEEEERQIKKRKLYLKDRMYQMIRAFRQHRM